MHIENLVAVVGDEALAVDRLTADLHQLAGNHAARHRNDFDRQREGAQPLDQLALIHHTDELLCRLSNDLFAGKRAAAAFDELQMAVGFVRTVDINRNIADFIEFEHRNAVFLQATAAGFGAGNGAFDTPLDAGQGIDEEVDRGAGAHADNGAGLDIFECGFGRQALLRILGHAFSPSLGCNLA